MPDARALVLDIGGVVLRNARELDLDRGIAGSDDDRWQAMLRHEITEREYWALRAREVGAVLGHHDWSTRQLITWLYHDADVEFVVDEMVELMDDARAAGLPVVALTNDMTDFHGQEWVDAQEWLEHFDAVVDASMTGDLEAGAGGLCARRGRGRRTGRGDRLPRRSAGERRRRTGRRTPDDRGAVRRPARRHRRGPPPTRAHDHHEQVKGEVMPLVRVDIMEGRPPEMIEELHRKLAELVAETLDTPIERVRTYITQFPPEAWGIGGVPANVARREDVEARAAAKAEREAGADG